MYLIPSATPDETITIGRAPGGRIELRIGRTAVLTAAEARGVAAAVVAAAEESNEVP